MQYLHKLKIGNAELENNIILAPMAGITDLPFRIICKKYNPGLVCTEMVSAKALYYNDEKRVEEILNMLKENEVTPIGVEDILKDFLLKRMTCLYFYPRHI